MFGGAGRVARPSGSTGIRRFAGLGPRPESRDAARPAGEVTQVSRVRASSLPARVSRDRTRADVELIAVLIPS